MLDATSPLSLCWRAAAMALLEKMSKQAQEERRRLEEGEENNEQWSMTQGALIIPQWRGWGCFITSFCPTIIDAQLIPTTKEVTMASRRTATHPILSQQYLTELLGAALPHGWGQASVTPPCKKSTTKRFPKTQPAFTTREKTLTPFQNLLNVCLWTCHQMLILRADTFISNEAVEYFIPPQTQYLSWV